MSLPYANQTLINNKHQQINKLILPYHWVCVLFPLFMISVDTYSVSNRKQLGVDEVAVDLVNRKHPIRNNTYLQFSDADTYSNLNS